MSEFKVGNRTFATEAQAVRYLHKMSLPKLTRLKTDDRTYYRGECRGHTFFVESDTFNGRRGTFKRWFARCSSLEIESEPFLTRDAATEFIQDKIDDYVPYEDEEEDDQP